MRVKICLILSLFFLNACAQAGWIGYYEMDKPATRRIPIANNTDNGASVEFSKQNIVHLRLPRGCSEYFITGIFTPFTPPIPIPHFRSWNWGQYPCNYFTIETRPEANVQLKTGNEIYAPETKEGLYGYTKYIFPIRAKNIDAGTLIIEKNGEKIEIPFEYKYFRFWH